MKYQKLKACIDTGRLQLGFWDKISHYFIVISCMALALMGLYLMVTAPDTEQHERSILIIYVTSSIALCFSIIQYRRLRFIIINTSLTHEEIGKVIDAAAGQLQWKTRTRGKNYYTATRNWAGFLDPSWGEDITIILTRHTIYINSICTLKGMSAVTAWGKNKKNVDVFKLELRGAETRKNSSAIYPEIEHPAT